MRHLKLGLFLLLGAVAASRTAHAQPPGDPGVDSYGDAGDPDQASDQYFQQRLTPYGRWVVRPGYGEVWTPRVSSGWRPYTTGHWVYSDQGWAWVADESWGWAPFHYGRWYYDASLGWSWVPGHIWAPAWVAWRNGGGYVGWAPLPPSVGFTAGVGANFGGVDIETAIEPTYYCFVPERAILEPRLSADFVPVSRNADLFHRSSNITRLTVVNNRVFNQGVDVQRIQQVTGHAVPRVRVANQSYFYQPPVVVAAARKVRTEKFVGRPAPRKVTAASTHNGAPATPAASSTSPSTARSSAKGHKAHSPSPPAETEAASHNPPNTPPKPHHPAHPAPPAASGDAAQAEPAGHGAHGGGHGKPPEHAAEEATERKPHPQPPPQEKGGQGEHEQGKPKGKPQPPRDPKDRQQDADPRRPPV